MGLGLAKGALDYLNMLKSALPLENHFPSIKPYLWLAEMATRIEAAENYFIRQPG